MALLEVKDLATSFRTDDGVVKAVSGVSFTLEKGETLGVVGESGSGKSVTFLTVMGLVDPKQSDVTGSVLLHGEEMLHASQSRMRETNASAAGPPARDRMICAGAAEGSWDSDSIMTMASSSMIRSAVGGLR